jgi:anti-anti-sigma regulatory factor
MLRFSLASLFVLILIAGLGCASLLYANDVWRQIMITLTMSVLLLATLAAVVGHRQSRAFALGFAISGWLYLLLVFSPWLSLRDDLLTDRTVAWLYGVVHDEDASQYYTTNPPYGRTVVSGTFQTVRLWDISGGVPGLGGSTFFNFADIGHALWSLFVASIGGLTAGLLWSRRQRAPRQPAAQRERRPEKAPRRRTPKPKTAGEPQRCPLCSFAFDSEASQSSQEMPCPSCGCRVQSSATKGTPLATVLVDVSRLLGVTDGYSDTKHGPEFLSQFSALVVTFREAAYVSCATIGALMLLYKQCAAKSRRLLFVVSPDNTIVRETFRKLRLDTIVEICDNEKEALNRIGS